MTSHFDSIPKAPREATIAPWAHRDDPREGPFEIRFVGNEVWAQNGGCVWRWKLGGEPDVLRVTNQLRLVRSRGPWVEFRTSFAMKRMLGGPGLLEGIYLYNIEDDRWHVGPWPSGYAFWQFRGVEPEDFILVEPFAGLRMDVARLDRHRPAVFCPNGTHALIDDQVIDLRDGSSVPYGLFALSSEFIRRFPSPPTVIGDPQAAEDTDQPFEASALGVKDDGTIWWADDGVLGRGEVAMAALSPHWRAAAFDGAVEKLVVMNQRRVCLVDLADLTSTRSELQFPWPWPDPFDAVDRRLGPRLEWYDAMYGDDVAADTGQRNAAAEAAARAAAEAPEMAPEEPFDDFDGVDEDDIIRF